MSKYGSPSKIKRNGHKIYETSTFAIYEIKSPNRFKSFRSYFYYLEKSKTSSDFLRFPKKRSKMMTLEEVKNII